jgi:hypothetical protein
MSINKIKERIRMIEENNFEINEVISNISTAQADTLVNLPNREKFLSRVGSVDANTEKIRNNAQSFFKTNTAFTLSNGDDVDLPTADENLIKDIYKVFINPNNLLTGEINDSTLEPTIGYQFNTNIIISLKGSDVQLYYTDGSLSKLTDMIIRVQSGYKGNIKDNNIQTIFNNLKKINGVQDVNVNQKNKRIFFTIKFN